MDAIAEVLSSTITGFVAECWPVDDDSAGVPTAHRPRFGSFLKVTCDNGTEVFAVVYNVITGPQDNMHKPSALRMSRKELQQQQPHIFALLKTEVHACIVGYAREGHFRASLPPLPPQVHDFVHLATQDEIGRLTANLEFLRLLSTISSVPTDELITAAVQEAARARRNDYNFLVQAGQNLTHLFREDYDRLTSILRKIHP